jgi:replicative DNA helicase
MNDLVQSVIATLEKRASGETTGIPTGFSDIDRVIGGGFQESEMFVVAGRPSAGKTSWAMNAVENIAARWLEQWERDHPGEPYAGDQVGVFSLEMTGEGLVERMIASLAQHNTRSLAYLSPAEYTRLTVAAGRASRLPVRIDDTPGLTIDTIRARARRMYSQHKVRLFVVDYAQLIEGGGEKGEETVRLGRISKGLKSLAKELRVPVVALAQLNRDFERDANRKPRMADLRGSGQYEQDADVIAMLYLRDPDEAERLAPDQPRQVLFRLVKQRNGIRDYDVPLRFFPAWTRFEGEAKVQT